MLEFLKKNKLQRTLDSLLSRPLEEPPSASAILPPPAGPASQGMSILAVAVGVFLLGLTTPLRVCTVSTCGRNGGQAFCDAVTLLSAGTELQVTASGCMSRCRGIVVAGGHLKGTTSLNLQLKDDAVFTLQSAVSFLDEAGVPTTALASSLVAKARGDEAMQAGDYAAAASSYTEAIDSPVAAELQAEMAAEMAALEPPVFRLAGRAALQEEERVTPRRVRWLYEALVGRCLSRLAMWHVGNAASAADASLAVAALSDACDATLVCPLAGGGWYRRRDAAHASANSAAAEEATAGLTKLGYALDVRCGGRSRPLESDPGPACRKQGPGLKVVAPQASGLLRWAVP